MEMKIFDIVKYEKKKAMERFTKLQRTKKLVKVFEVVFVLILLYWSTMKVPLVVRFFSKLFELSVSLLNPHFVFLIGNAIILAVFFLCKQHGAGINSGNGDVYAVDSGRSEASPPLLTSPEMFTRVAEESQLLEADKRVQILSSYSTSPKLQKEFQIVETHKQVESSSPSAKVQKESEMVEAHKRVQILSSSSPSPKVEKESQIVETHKRVQILSSSSPRQKVLCEAVEVAIAEAKQEIRRFERTLSEKLKREISVRPREELRRSQTERRVVMRPSIKAVEHLTNEEFKSAIDAFIDKHRVFSKE